MKETTEKKTSKTLGFENTGKFTNHILEKTLEYKLSPYSSMVLLLLVKYSFGYMKNIQFELQISNQQIQDALGYSKPTIIKALKELIEYNLIQRIKWQDFGSKQAYKYRVIFPEGYHIALINEEEEAIQTKEQLDKEHTEKMNKLL